MLGALILVIGAFGLVIGSYQVAGVAAAMFAAVVVSLFALVFDRMPN